MCDAAIQFSFRFNLIISLGLAPHCTKLLRSRSFAALESEFTPEMRCADITVGRRANVAPGSSSEVEVSTQPSIGARRTPWWGRLGLSPSLHSSEHLMAGRFTHFLERSQQECSKVHNRNNPAMLPKMSSLQQQTRET